MSDLKSRGVLIGDIKPIIEGIRLHEGKGIIEGVVATRILEEAYKKLQSKPVVGAVNGIG